MKKSALAFYSALLVFDILGVLFFLIALLFPQIGLADTVTLYVVTELPDGEVNVRLHPWMGSEVISRVNGGDMVTVDAYTNGWAHIVDAKNEYGEGYISMDFLSADPAKVGVYANYTGGRVRIRATMGGETQSWLKAGKQITVIGWLIDTNGKEWAHTAKGWIDAACLTPIQ